jgi:hypothetical protein
MLDEITTLIDAGASNGFLRIYDGTRPATGGAVTTLLAELDFADPSFAAAAAGVLTANAIVDEASAAATGTATWFRAVDDAGAAVIDGDVGASGSDLNLNTTSIVITNTVAVSSFVITAGNP